MPLFRPFLVILLPTLLPLSAADWPGWRGPGGNGLAADGENPPLTWSASRNVVWKTEIPGQGHSSPVIMGDRIFLTAADEGKGTQSVLCLHRDSGSVLWETVVARGRLPGKIHRKNTHATPTAACDGSRVYAVFHVDEEVLLVSLTLEGKEVWKIRAGGFLPQYQFGYAASPLLHGDLVIVVSDYKPDGFLAAFRRGDGTAVWRAPRGEGTSYSSPVVARLGGKDQLLLSGHGKITSYDPVTGKAWWEGTGCTKATCGTVVWDGNLVFASGGFPNKETVAMRADGSGTVVWKNNVQAYEQSMLVHAGHVYALDDNGVAHCWRAADGTERWRERLGGPVSSSPVLAGGRIHVGNERGQVFVLEPNPEKFTLLATNQLGDDLFATPAFCDDRIYLRVGVMRGRERSEALYCIGKPKD